MTSNEELDRQELEKYRQQKLRKQIYYKEYSQRNRSRLNQKQLEYYYANKERLLQVQTCDLCGGKFSKYTKAQHERMKKHLKALNKNVEHKELIPDPTS